jgi:NAD(P)-dependent dehydrogenase (short-subunit alcohol dehydrogenase family)
MSSRVCVVTGATRGIGRATALQLARRGAKVVMVGRDEQRLDATRVELQRLSHNTRIFWVHADFASLASVRVAAEEISHRWPAIHVLINNAGINAPRREDSADGYELTLAVNHLAPFSLTLSLVPALSRGAPSRVVNVTSVFAFLGGLRLDDLTMTKGRYNATRAYTQSKLANMMFTVELASRLEGTGIAVNCVSPGLVATDLLRDHWYAVPWLRSLWSRALMTPARAAERIVRTATSDTLGGMSGHCFASSEHPSAMPRRVRDADTRRRLWDASMALTNAPDVAMSLRSAR